MGRIVVGAWALLVSIWAGMVGGAVVFEPSIDHVPLYAVSFTLVAFPAAYATISRNPEVFATAHRPGRVATYILVSFVVTVLFAVPFELLLGHTSGVAVVAQLVAFTLGLWAGLYAAYGGGLDAAFERYT
ncbi:hypothetical protein [Haloarcula litorea]|uniref:hypothetical protein n=1 Tax=Haloarcula litorea TaxID=3032579 RepID=UPI0023E77289|nr:hypothetical protein [Halomicroarcula sp. GDY20]